MSLKLYAVNVVLYDRNFLHVVYSCVAFNITSLYLISVANTLINLAALVNYQFHSFTISLFYNDMNLSLRLKEYIKSMACDMSLLTKSQTCIYGT